ncbi:hypothetical protein AB4Z42_13795 [Mycobacterium sp. 2YAF39]|uniref:hypothetical protein n=1 Tax=Mycobacterium sp. 2YAF39 TaxID=3233033 RepID=UPI003F995ECD
MTTMHTDETKFNNLLQEQIRIESSASQQYIAIATYFAADDLPQLADRRGRAHDETAARSAPRAAGGHL